MTEKKNVMHHTTKAGNPVYFFGMIGALVYYLQHAHHFWPVVLAVFKGLVWPAFVVHDLLKFLYT
jgi:hypothetical protein